MPKTDAFVRNECIIEIRYKPNSRLLDHRGKWAEAISQHMKLEHWQIVENRIDIFNEGKTIHSFFGYRNGGITISNVPNEAFFQNYTKNLFSYVFALEDFGNPIFVERIGVRSKFCTPFSGTFRKLRDKFVAQYVNLTEQAIDALGDAKLLDIGSPLNFQDNLGKFNTMSGPMSKEQFPQFFTIQGTFPGVGLFYDIDYWDRPKKEMDSNQLIDKINKFFGAGWNRHTRVRDLIING